MAYDGYLIKIGDYEISAEKYIKAQSYHVTRNVQDLDSYRDANGILHRNTLEHVPLKVEFATPEMLTNSDVAELFGNISSRYVSKTERKVLVTSYVPEKDDYVTQEMYMPNPKFSIYKISKEFVTYQSIQIVFIGY